jgi:hypothetical protein
VVGALIAPVLAAIGAVVALLKDCTIQVERGDQGPAASDRREDSAEKSESV